MARRSRSDSSGSWYLLSSGRHHRAGRLSSHSMLEAVKRIQDQFAYKYIVYDEVSGPVKKGQLIINKPKMKTLTPQQEALLDADTKTLLQAGFLNDDFTPSNKGLDASEAIQFETNKAVLLVKAAAVIAAANTTK